MSVNKTQGEGESKPVPPKQFDAKGEKNFSDGSDRKNCQDSSNVDQDGIPKKESGKME